MNINILNNTIICYNNILIDLPDYEESFSSTMRKYKHYMGNV